LVQDTPEEPPEKLFPVPWQFWQYAKPAVELGAAFAPFGLLP
jgi:hypothetical protein